MQSNFVQANLNRAPSWFFSKDGSAAIYCDTDNLDALSFGQSRHHQIRGDSLWSVPNYLDCGRGYEKKGRRGET